MFHDPARHRRLILWERHPIRRRKERKHGLTKRETKSHGKAHLFQNHNFLRLEPTNPRRQILRAHVPREQGHL